MSSDFAYMFSARRGARLGGAPEPRPYQYPEKRRDSEIAICREHSAMCRNMASRKTDAARLATRKVPTRRTVPAPPAPPLDLLFEHDLFREPVSTLRDHALSRAFELLRPDGEQLCQRTRWPDRLPLGGECGRKRRLSVAQRCLDQREIDKVALGMAAAEPLRHIAHRAQALHTLGVAGVAERLEGEHDRPADFAREGRVVAGSCHRGILGLQQSPH